MSRDYKPVASSNVAGVDYDKDTRHLHVKFVNGSEYVYHDVPEDEFEGLLGASSPGNYLNENIKGVYHYTRA